MTTKKEVSTSKYSGSEIVTAYDYVPGPTRDYDWAAYRADWDLGWPMGYGSTEEDAIQDLKELELDLEN